MKKIIMFSAVLLSSVGLAQAASLLVDREASSVAWKGTKKMGSAHNGHVGVKQGEIELDKKNQLKGGSIVIDMKTIGNEDLKDSPDNQKKLVGHLSSSDFFDVQKYPESKFRIISVTPKTKDEVLVKGDFTMIGKTNPIEFPAKVKFEKGVFTGEGTVKIDRTKWGLKYGSGSFFKELTGDKIINDEFELNVKLVTKQ